METEAYLLPSEYIDFNHPAVLEKAADLTIGLKSEEEIAEACFKFVRDMGRIMAEDYEECDRRMYQGRCQISILR